MGLSRCRSNERQRRLFDFPRNFGRENLVSLSVVATRKIVKIVVREINDFRSENLTNKVSRVRPGVPFTVLGTQFRLTLFVFRLFLR